MTSSDYGPDAGVYWIGLPRSWTKGRTAHGVKLSVAHTTEGHADANSAEQGHVIDVGRTDGTSCHVFHDSDSSPQEVLRSDRSHSAFQHGNDIGIHHEQCGTASWTALQWQTPYAKAMRDRMARAQADDCKTYGLQVRRLTVAEVRAAYYDNGPGGICGHYDITRAFPEDGGTHTDPGPNFPWSEHIAAVLHYVNGGDPLWNGTDMNVYTFGSLTDCPPELKSSNNAIYVCTDGVGAYWVRNLASWQYGSAKLNGSAPVNVTLGANVDGALPLGTPFATAFAELTGGCVFDPTALRGVADYRKPAAAAGGDHTHTATTVGATGPAIPLTA
jgi:Negative regulator of beta-lactamase expression